MKIAVRSIVLIAAPFAFGLLYNQASSRGIPLTQHPLQATSNLHQEAFLDLAAARSKFEAGVPFLDARAEDFYLLGHVRGAMSLPVSDFDLLFPKKQAELPPRDREVVCYCSGYGCEESIELAQKLRENGFQRVYVFLGGWPEWSEAGLPAETPPP